MKNVKYTDYKSHTVVGEPKILLERFIFVSAINHIIPAYYLDVKFINKQQNSSLPIMSKSTHNEFRVSALPNVANSLSFLELVLAIFPHCYNLTYSLQMKITMSPCSIVSIGGLGHHAQISYRGRVPHIMAWLNQTLCLHLCEQTSGILLIPTSIPNRSYPHIPLTLIPQIMSLTPH